MNLENICYIVGAASLDGVRLSPRPGDYVIAADGGYRTLKARGIEPDFVMGDFDSLGYRPDHPNVETHPVMKDDTDLGLAVRWALAHGYRRLVIAGALGGRLDQTIASFQTLRGLTDAARRAGSSAAAGWSRRCKTARWPFPPAWRARCPSSAAAMPRAASRCAACSTRSRTRSCGAPCRSA